AWAVRLLGQLDRELNEKTWDELWKLASKDSSPDVRLQLAASCQRWSKLPRKKGQRWTCFWVIRSLVHRDEDAKDPVIPLMDWLALEPHTVALDAFRFIDPVDFLVTTGGLLKEEHPLLRYHIVPRMLRRWAS